MGGLVGWLVGHGDGWRRIHYIITYSLTAVAGGLIGGLSVGWLVGGVDA
jgi:hypothetical protein